MRRREQSKAGSATTLRALNRHLATVPACFNNGCWKELPEDSATWTDTFLTSPFLILALLLGRVG